MEALLAASLFVGVARAISVALTDGQVFDTIVYCLASLLDDVPRLAAGALMVPIHCPDPRPGGVGQRPCGI